MQRSEVCEVINTGPGTRMHATRAGYQNLSEEGRSLSSKFLPLETRTWYMLAVGKYMLITFYILCYFISSYFLFYPPCCSCCCSIAKLCLTHVIPWTLAHQPPLSKGFPRQEYWNGLPFLPLRDLPNPGIDLMSPALAGGLFTTEPPGKPYPPW